MPPRLVKNGYKLSILTISCRIFEKLAIVEFGGFRRTCLMAKKNAAVE